jgi:hypothetical protein
MKVLRLTFYYIKNSKDILLRSGANVPYCEMLDNSHLFVEEKAAEVSQSHT